MWDNCYYKCTQCGEIYSETVEQCPFCHASCVKVNLGKKLPHVTIKCPICSYEYEFEGNAEQEAQCPYCQQLVHYEQLVATTNSTINDSCHPSVCQQDTSSKKDGLRSVSHGALFDARGVAAHNHLHKKRVESVGKTAGEGVASKSIQDRIVERLRARGYDTQDFSRHFEKSKTKISRRRPITLTCSHCKSLCEVDKDCLDGSEACPHCGMRFTSKTPTMTRKTMPLRHQDDKAQDEIPDSIFSVDKDEYEVGGKRFVDVSRKGFWSGIAASFKAGWNGDDIITECDRKNGKWGAIKSTRGNMT